MKNKNLIVFCPGFSGLPPQARNPLLNRFQGDGYDVVSIKYKYFGFGDIQDTALRTEHVISSMREFYDHICLIGHSMGGLVARSVNPGLYDSYVSIASPHRGIQSPIQSSVGNRVTSVKQMMRGSEFLTNLPWPEHTPHRLNVLAHLDMLVPSDASEVNLEKFKQIKIPWTDHLTILTSFRTYGEIYAWLTYEVLNSIGKNESEGFYSEVKL